MMRRNLLVGAAALAPVIVGLSNNSPAAAAVTNPGLIASGVQGRAGPNRTNLSSTFRGRVRITGMSIDRQTRTLKVAGRINGVVTRPNGSTVAINERPFVADAELTGGSVAADADAQSRAVCSILNLNIGRITLNLLGLFIDLSPITLVISALSGPGALLGNLLCALVALLDSARSLLSTILALLEQINTILANNRIPVG